MLHNGLYEQIINKGLDAELSVTDKLSQTAPIDSAEASKVLSKYVAEIVEKGLNNVKDNGGNLTSQVELVNRIVSTIITETKEADFDTLSVAERAEQLLALFDKKNNCWHWTKGPRSSVRKPPSHKAHFSPGLCMSHRCLQSSKRKSSRPIGSICWCPSSNGAVCGSSWTNCGSLRTAAASSASSPPPTWAQQM